MREVGLLCFPIRMLFELNFLTRKVYIEVNILAEYKLLYKVSAAHWARTAELSLKRSKIKGKLYGDAAG